MLLLQDGVDSLWQLRSIIISNPLTQLSLQRRLTRNKTVPTAVS